MISLKTCKYKGVSFLFESMPTTFGNRLIKYNYPGSDKQSIERQGKAPRTFTITAIIPHDNYYQKKDELMRVLEDGEKGVLTHPTFGDVENIINGICTLEEIISDLGRAKITIPFEIDDSTGIPVQSDNLVSQVQQESDILNEQLKTDLADGFNVTNNFSGNFDDAIESVNNILDSFIEASRIADPIAEKAAEFTQQIGFIRGKINEIVQAPIELAESTFTLYESLNNLYETPDETLGALISMFKYGDNDPVVKTNTAIRIERKNNRDLLRNNIKTQALSYAYVNAGLIEYETTDGIELVENTLEEQYTSIRNEQIISNNALEDLDRTRVQSQKNLDNVSVTTKQIITIETKMIPLSVLVYAYYGSTELVDIIADLNNIKQNAFVVGELRILTA